jgi:spermidine/putrescine transport system substrate-binding protein
MISNMGKEKSFVISFFSRLVIFLFFVLGLSLFLYFPYVYDLFFIKEDVINIFTFTDMISTDVVEEFKQQTGISVKLKYFDTVEELYAKFKINKGEGYDLITPTDYILEMLIQENLVQKIDKTKLSNLKYLDNRLLGHFFDPENKYCIPHMWSVYGIVYNKNEIKVEPEKFSWNLVFEKPDYKICMLPDARDQIFLAAIYLFGRINNLTNDELGKIQKLLIEQKKWVEIYMHASLQYYLFSNVVPLAVSSSAFAKKVLELNNDFDFVVPSQGSILTVEVLSIPRKSKKVDLAHKFIDFLISKEISLMNSEEFGYNPANTQCYEEIKKIFKKDSIFTEDQVFKKLHIMHNELDLKVIEKLWLNVKLA